MFDPCAAPAPMSIFGSLGVVSAGFKASVACQYFSFEDIEGTKILAEDKAGYVVSFGDA